MAGVCMEVTWCLGRGRGGGGLFHSGDGTMRKNVDVWRKWAPSQVPARPLALAGACSWRRRVVKMDPGGRGRMLLAHA